MRNNFKHYGHWKVNLYDKGVKVDKQKLREEIDAATIEYLKNNQITHLPNTPDIKPSSVKVKDLREISDIKEFYYLEEENENNPY